VVCGKRKDFERREENESERERNRTDCCQFEK